MLQGDSLSPHLLNLSFSTLLLMVNQERLKCLGHTSNTLTFLEQLVTIGREHGSQHQL